MADPFAAGGFEEEDPDFDFEDQLAQEEAFADEEEERWGLFAASVTSEGAPSEDPARRKGESCELPVDVLASHQARFRANVYSCSPS